jgi:hypothetical protein
VHYRLFLLLILKETARLSMGKRHQDKVQYISHWYYFSSLGATKSMTRKPRSGLPDAHIQTHARTNCWLLATSALNLDAQRTYLNCEHRVVFSAQTRDDDIMMICQMTSQPAASRQPRMKEQKDPGIQRSYIFPITPNYENCIKKRSVGPIGVQL